jgi:hypothetical protein
MDDGEYCIPREETVREEEEVTAGFAVGCIPSFAG